MKKDKLKKTNRIEIRLNFKDYIFLQNLREDNIKMTDFILNSIKNTTRYKKYISIIE